MSDYTDPDPKELICLQCKNYIGDFTCLAFPDGIPDKIVFETNKHDIPTNDQENEIVFEKE